MKKIVVTTNSRKDFDDLDEAREYAIKLLQAGLTFLKIEMEEN